MPQLLIGDTSIWSKYVLAKDPALSLAANLAICQHYYGMSTDGHDFNFKFRYTGFLHKKDGVWQWVQEHVSFPANIATRKAAFTCNQDAGEHIMMQDEDNVKRDEASSNLQKASKR